MIHTLCIILLLIFFCFCSSLEYIVWSRFKSIRFDSMIYEEKKREEEWQIDRYMYGYAIDVYRYITMNMYLLVDVYVYLSLSFHSFLPLSLSIVVILSYSPEQHLFSFFPFLSFPLSLSHNESFTSCSTSSS